LNPFPSGRRSTSRCLSRSAVIFAVSAGERSLGRPSNRPGSSSRNPLSSASLHQAIRNSLKTFVARTGKIA
jgi:hypothetical protein